MDAELFLQSLPLFQGVKEGALARLAAESRFRLFPAGALLFRQGEAGATCHIIARGRVRVFVATEDGRELSVRILGPGEIVGEMAVFEDLPRSASVEALEETEALELHRDALLRAVREDSTLALRLLQSLSARLRHATAEAEGLASLTVAERLMRSLEQLAQWAGRSVAGGVQIALPLTQQELASLIGTSRESVNRALARLRRQGRVRLDEGWVILLTPPAPAATAPPRSPGPAPRDGDGPDVS